MKTIPEKQCAILVGGLGTRLGPLTADCPKPLLPVAGQPFLYHLLRNVRRFGYDDFLLLAGHQSDRVDAFASSALQTELDCRIRVIAEPAPLGTGGALLHAADVLQERFLLLNGDSFFDFNLLDLCTRLVRGKVLARIALRRVPDASRYGTVELDANRIIAFRERPQSPGPGLVNGGVYDLSSTILEHIGEGACSLERDVFQKLAAKRALAGFAYNGFFLDIGIPDDLVRARQAIPLALRRPAVFFTRNGVLNQVGRNENFRWNDGVPQTIRRLNDLGWYVFVVTDQSGAGAGAGAAHGYAGEHHARKLHVRMNEELQRSGAHIDDFRYCPPQADGSEEGCSQAGAGRKPGPGMLLDLLENWPVDVHRSFLIGDKESDLDAASVEGLKEIRFFGGNIGRAIRANA